MFGPQNFRVIKKEKGQKERFEGRGPEHAPGYICFSEVLGSCQSGGTAAGISPLNAALDIKTSRWRFFFQPGAWGGRGGGGGGGGGGVEVF